MFGRRLEDPSPGPSASEPQEHKNEVAHTGTTEEEPLPTVVHKSDAQPKVRTGKVRTGVAGTVTLEHTAEFHWAAPLPDPHTLREFGEIVPDLPERIISQWEKQTDHRIDIEQKVIDSNIAKEGRGQWMGFSVFLAGILGSIWLVSRGITGPGLTIFFSDIISLAVVYVVGGEMARRTLRKQRPELVKQEQTDLFDDDVEDNVTRS